MTCSSPQKKDPAAPPRHDHSPPTVGVRPGAVTLAVASVVLVFSVALGAALENDATDGSMQSRCNSRAK
jgi:hypothetical protein